MEAQLALRVRGSPFRRNTEYHRKQDREETGKMMIEVQTFFTRLNILKSLAAIIHAFESRIFVSSQVLDRYFLKLSPPH